MKLYLIGIPHRSWASSDPGTDEGVSFLYTLVKTPLPRARKPPIQIHSVHPTQPPRKKPGGSAIGGDVRCSRCLLSILPVGWLVAVKLKWKKLDNNLAVSCSVLIPWAIHQYLRRGWLLDRADGRGGAVRYRPWPHAISANRSASASGGGVLSMTAVAVRRRGFTSNA
jgi:hypothetical protein